MIYVRDYHDSRYLSNSFAGIPCLAPTNSPAVEEMNISNQVPEEFFDRYSLSGIRASLREWLRVSLRAEESSAVDRLR
jgi:hypothetical protein